MERDEFINALKSEGYAEIATATRDANGTVDDHVHSFEAKALILHGELAIRVGAAEQVYRTGDVFHLQANESHSERYGPEGVQYLVGRK
ncbi:cupin [Paraburkholderia caribensis]|jgi:quercetin dioxygenase-like cupin family protein|uniref:cupin domain-containing protein n=1 Tax=Paraburkholderia caribensis TaxID=75105 RepID=UPI0031DF0C87